MGNEKNQNLEMHMNLKLLLKTKVLKKCIALAG